MSNKKNNSPYSLRAVRKKPMQKHGSNEEPLMPGGMTVCTNLSMPFSSQTTKPSGLP